MTRLAAVGWDALGAPPAFLSWLSGDLGDLLPPPPTGPDDLLEGKVVTGQQPGLFGGSMVHLLKAAGAVRLAEEAGRDAVFWNHSEDHDFAEACRIRLVAPGRSDVHTLALEAPSGRPFLSDIVLGDEAAALFEKALGVLDGLPRLEEAAKVCRPIAGARLGEAFTAFLDCVFAKRLAAVEPREIRERTAPVLARAARAAGRLSEAADGDEAALRSLGLEPPVLDAGAAPWMFTEAAGQRTPVRLAEGGWRVGDERDLVAPDELADRIEGNPADWGPGVLLRPVCQGEALNVAVYLGGPTEIAYHAQTRSLFELLEVPRSPLLPRPSVTVVDRPVADLLNRLGLDPADCFRPEDQMLERLPAPPDPPVLDRIRAAAASAAEDVRGLEDALSDIDPDLSKAGAKTVGSVERSFLQLERKTRNAHRSRAGAGRSQAAMIAGTFFPARAPQERVWGPLQLMAQTGPAVVDQLTQDSGPFAMEHAVIVAEESEST